MYDWTGIAIGVIIVLLLMTLYGAWKGFSVRDWAADMLGMETFATRQDKAQAVVAWFARNPIPQYANYRTEIAGDVVEYEDMLALKTSNKMDIGHVRRYL